MLVTFRSKVGDITMFGDVGITMLKLMGQTGAVPGAILADDLPAALAQLKSGLQQAAAPDDVAAPTPAKADADAEPPIALGTRAKPLIDLLERAIRARADITW